MNKKKLLISILIIIGIVTTIFISGISNATTESLNVTEGINTVHSINNQSAEEIEHLIGGPIEVNENAMVEGEGFLEDFLDWIDGKKLETEHIAKTPATTKQILDALNAGLDNFNDNQPRKTGRDIEKWIEDNIYTYANIICFKHWRSLTSNHNQILEQLPHVTDEFDLNDYVYGDGGLLDGNPIGNVIYSEKISYKDGENAVVKPSPMVILALYNNGSYKHTHDLSTRINRSNYNAVKIGNYKLKDMQTNEDSYSNNYEIPYILAFSDKQEGVNLKYPTESQKALWGLTGNWETSCNIEETPGINDYEHRESDLFKAAMGVDLYEEDSRPKEDITVKIPDGVQAGTVYYEKDLYDTFHMEDEEPLQPENISARADTRLRIGPFQMGDYAYAFSEYVGEYSGRTKDKSDYIEYPDVIGGIVGGRITISGDSGSSVYEIGNGTDEEGNPTVRIVYKDWYDYVAQAYPGSSSDDVRGDIRYKDNDYLYAPIMDGEMTERKTNTVSKEILKSDAPGNPADYLQIKIKENGEEIYYPYPLPNSVFYIEIPVILLGNTAEEAASKAHWLESITFDYRTTETSGTGDSFVVRCVETKTSFSQSGSSAFKSYDQPPCTTYNCTEGPSGCSTSRSPGYSFSPYTGNCTHSYYTDCTTEERTGTRTVTTTNPDGTTSTSTEEYTYDVHVHGTYHSETYVHTYVCKHGHQDCQEAYWTTSVNDIIYGQPMVRIDEAKVQVKRQECESELNVRIFVNIGVQKYAIYTWHGWDTAFRTDDGNILDLDIEFEEDPNGILDNLLGWIFNSEEEKPITVGDAVTYRYIVTNASDIDLYMWVRDVYPKGMVANDNSRVFIYKANYLLNSHLNNGWDNPQNWVVEDAPATESGRVLVKAKKKVFMKINFIVTNEIELNKNGTFKNYAQIASLDEKYKDEDNPHDRSPLNVNFNRTHYDEGSANPRHYGPVATCIFVDTNDPMIMKHFAININKYIYDVEHVKDINDNTIGPDDSRYNNRAEQDATYVQTPLGTIDDIMIPLQEAHAKNEEFKKNNPVYVEYGDKITYKIEVDNTTIVEEKDSPYEDPDLLYVTVKDTLPEKYSGLKVDEITYEPQQGAHLQIESEPAEESESGGTIIFKDLMVPENGKTTITMTLVVEEHEKEKGKAAKETVENKAEILVDESHPVYNYNRGTESEPMRDVWCDVSQYSHIVGTSSDWYEINDYNIDIDKYISSYDAISIVNNNNLDLTRETTDINQNGFNSSFAPGTTVQENEDRDRMDQTELNKYYNPVHVEKGDQIIYSIRLENKSEKIFSTFAKGDKPATQVRVESIRETLSSGLEVKAVRAIIYKDNDIVDREVDVEWGTGRQFDIVLEDIDSEESLLEPDEYIVYYVTVEVTESNMSLKRLQNSATIMKLSNINSLDTDAQVELTDDIREVKNDSYDENIADPVEKTSYDYVRMKDLIIAGYVWIDKDRNGLKESNDLSSLTSEEKTRYNVTGPNAGKAGVVVKLYRVDNGVPTLLRTTKTDANGKYSFSRLDDGYSYRNSSEYSSLGDISSGKPTFNEDGANTAEKYQNNSTMSYYQRVDKADGKDEYGNYVDGATPIDYYIEFEYDGILYKSTEIYAGIDNLTGEGRFNSTYYKDSNAAEKVSERKNFNNNHTYVSYNQTYNSGKGATSALAFDKIGHESLLKDDPSRIVRATSFLSKDNYEDINLLWLYEPKASSSPTPETEYLKYINLGLELREEVDIALTKDVYKVKTTVNGEEMEYDFNKNAVLNGPNVYGQADPADEANYIIDKPYGLEIYEFDYKYRFEQYISEQVEKYKTENSELNVEVTYRITINNKEATDDDDLTGTTDERLNVRIDEILDLYDKNFITLDSKPNNEITVKDKTDEGLLVDKQIKTVEAWYYASDVNGKYRVKAGSPVGNPIYEEVTDGGVGTHSRVELKVSTTSNGFVEYSGTDYSNDAVGYKKLYITDPADKIVIPEGGKFDVYIKYVLDKDAAGTEATSAIIEVNNEAYQETSTINEFGKDKAITGIVNNEVNTSSVKLLRSLKIVDTKAGPNNRGIENIAQVNGYSVWYTNNDGSTVGAGSTIYHNPGDPAAIVDRNSNVGNIGKDGNSVDNPDAYDDTAYKTGIVFAVEGTEYDKERIKNDFGELEVVGTTNIDRIITGTVWDDARSETMGSSETIQYLGNGLKADDEAHEDARINENVKLNYNVGDKPGEKDTPVRNAKAEFIEIVKVPVANGSDTEMRYYEEILEDVTWQQVQHTRTDADGKYQLEGFIPGSYIVRFTYGDTLTSDPGKSDMVLFNGQDYKSTKFNENYDDEWTDIDTIMKELEVENKSDARDDEIRRLEVNAYSEVMTNPVAEILKGLGNGTILKDENGNEVKEANGDPKYITPNNKDKNNDDQLKTLTDNTYMEAETPVFTVKAEKLTEGQTPSYTASGSGSTGAITDMLYQYLTAIKEDHVNQRQFAINNIDFGIEYRPESEIRLTKEINEIRLTTEDNEVLVDLFFYTTGEGADTKHHIDKEKSIGANLVQFVTNDYDELLSRLTNEAVQGFVYIQVDDEILQGCTIQVFYNFEAENHSEVDRISKLLDKMRYKENPATPQDKITSVYPAVDVEDDDNTYTASETARNIIYDAVYVEEFDNPTYQRTIKYRKIPKTTIPVKTVNISDMSETEMLNGYYGRFVGYGYYTGLDVTGTGADDIDTIATLKFDKILDYVDVDLEYEQESTMELTENRLWTKTTAKDLEPLISLLNKDFVKAGFASGKLEDQGSKTNGTGTPVAGTPAVNTAVALKNRDGQEYRTLVVSLDDRRKDDPYTESYGESGDPDATVRNKDLSRFLLPQVTDTTENKVKSTGRIILPVSKVLGAGTDSDDMTYENMAEIIQFTTLTGRRTNFATTIGNADVEGTKPVDTIGSAEFTTSTIESDTAATETITLIPPTGLMRNRKTLVTVVETAKIGFEVIVIIATVAVAIIIVTSSTLFARRKYKKRRIK